MITCAEELKKIVRDVPDFPKPGILFKDITPLLKSPECFNYMIDCLARELATHGKIDFVAGIESRGFIMSPVLAYKLKAGFIPVRKKGKLPFHTEQESYALEYGEAVLEIHQDAVEPGSRVVIIDDLLATGGTAQAAVRLIEKLGGKVVNIAFLIELLFLEGRKKLSSYDIFSLIQY